jgi:hypothetical protein
LRYDGAVGLLWEGFAGDRLTREKMRSSLGRARERAFARLAGWLDRAEQRPLAEGVRLALASLPEDSTPAEILSTFPVAVAALLRRRQGDAPLAPEPARATADDPDALLDQAETAFLLRTTPRTLQAWRLRGGGPAFVSLTSPIRALWGT